MLVAVLTGGMFFLIQDFLIETRGFSCAYKCDMSPNPASFGSHCHEDYEMIFILDGRGRYVVEGREYTMNPGMLIILKPGEFHYAEILGTHPYERYVVHFERPLLSELCLQYLDYICDPSSNVSNCYDPDVVPGRVRVIFDGFRYGSMMNDLTKRTYCSMLIFEILIFIADKAGKYGDEVTDNNSISTAIMNYINSNLTSEVSLDELARQFFVSKYYLCHNFKERNGITIHSYLTKKRVVLAKQYIDNGESASSAAERVGFRDYSSFYRAYIKYMGESPTFRTSKKRREKVYLAEDFDNGQTRLDILKEINNIKD